MARHKRAKAVYSADRDDLLRRAYCMWLRTCAAMFTVELGSDAYKTAFDLAMALCDFARRISGGKTDFATMMSSTRAGGPQPWRGAADETEADISMR